MGELTTATRMGLDGERTDGYLIRRLFGLAWRFPADFLLSLGLSVAVLSLSLAGLQILGLVIDVIRHSLDPSSPAPSYPWGWTVPADWSPFRVVSILSLGIVLQALLSAALAYSYSAVTARLTQGKIVPYLREQLYAKLQHLSFGFFDAHGSNSIFNRVTTDAQNTRLFVDGVILQGITTVLTLGAYAVFMGRIHLALTLACLSVAVPLAILTQAYAAKLRPQYRRNRELADLMVLSFTESVRGMQTVKGFSAESHRAECFNRANDEVTAQQRRIFRDLSLFTPLTQALSHVSLVILFVYGGWLYLHGKVPLGGGLVVFAGLLQQFTSQVANLSTITNSVQQSLTAAGRVFEVLDATVEVRSKPDAVPTGGVAGGVRFEKVSFAYIPDKPVLSEIDFEIQPGQTIGIFGLTGSGKSTLLSLIPRFYDPTQGRILVDAKDLRDLDLEDFRRQVGIVTQETFLFSNTVAANIAFGHPEATLEEIREAAKLASAHEFISALPEGYDTVLGESGVDLSGGQRQRIALARALLLKPSILILDDPTASVDPRTEHEIVEALVRASAGRTTFIVSGRVSLLRRTERILVLQEGRLLHSGSPEQLVHVPGPFRETALLQLMDLGAKPEGAGS